LLLEDGDEDEGEIVLRSTVVDEVEDEDEEE